MVRIDFDSLNSWAGKRDDVLTVCKFPDKITIRSRSEELVYSYYTSAPEVAFAKVLEAFNEDD